MADNMMINYFIEQVSVKYNIDEDELKSLYAQMADNTKCGYIVKKGKPGEYVCNNKKASYNAEMCKKHTNVFVKKDHDPLQSLCTYVIHKKDGTVASCERKVAEGETMCKIHHNIQRCTFIVHVKNEDVVRQCKRNAKPGSSHCGVHCKNDKPAPKEEEEDADKPAPQEKKKKKPEPQGVKSVVTQYEDLFSDDDD
jgi:hypothetical protein